MSIVIFSTQVPIGTGQGVYMTAVAQEVTGAELDRGLAVFSRRSLTHGGAVWTREDVHPQAGLRLYRAAAQDIPSWPKTAAPDHRITARLNLP